MNIHPIFVHFPLAFLSVYAFFEIVRIKQFTRAQWYLPVKKALLYIGTLTSFLTLQTGEMAEEALGFHSNLVEAHSTWATGSVWIFAILAIAYLIPIFETKNWFSRIRFTSVIAKYIRLYAPVIALIGLIAITIAGALGGAIVYGKNADPIVRIVYNLIIGN